LTPACAGLLERKESGLGLLKSIFNAKNSVADYLRPSPAISAQFTLKMYVADRNCQKITKTLYFNVHSHSKSSMLKLLRSSSLVLVMTSSIFTLDKPIAVK